DKLPHAALLITHTRVGARRGGSDSTDLPGGARRRLPLSQLWRCDAHRVRGYPDLSALQEWYRYVDSLVRPSRQFEELEEWWIGEESAPEGDAPTEDDSTPPRRPDDEGSSLHTESAGPLHAGTDSAVRPAPSAAIARPTVNPHAVVARLAAEA